MSEITYINFKNYIITSYAGQDVNSIKTVLDNGNTLKITKNGWNKIAFPYQVTANTILEFDFKSNSQGEVHGLGFDTDNKASENLAFQLYGTQVWGNTSLSNYQSSAGNWKHYQISVGNFFVGNMLYLTFINDHDVTLPTAESLFSNLKVHERLETRDDDLTTDENTQITISASNLLSNDIGTSLQIIRVSNAINGNVVLNNGTISFTPNSNFHGTAKFNYVVRDRDGKTSTAIVNLIVNPLNNLPFASSDAVTTNENMPILIPGSKLLENDIDLDNDNLSLIEVDNAINGEVQIDNNSNVVFKPNTNFSGKASFNYKISDGRQGKATGNVAVTVNPLRLSFNNHRIESYDSSQDIQSIVTRLDNGNTLKIVGNGWKKIAFPYNITNNTILEFDFKSSVQGETHAIGFDTDNVISPDRAFQLYGTQLWGINNFKNYQLSVGSWKHYRIPVGQFFRGQMQYLTFANDHDISNALGEGLFSNVQVYETLDAITDNLTINEDTPIEISPSSILANDKGFNLNLLGVSNPTHGSVALNSNGNIVFTPEANFYGIANFTYTIADSNNNTDNGTVQVTIEPINDAPVAKNDTAITIANVPLTLSSATLLANDLSVDNDSLSLTAVGNATRGTVSLNQGNILFTPEANFNGQASFQYTLRDTTGLNTQGTVTINVQSPYLGTNLAPIADFSSEVPFIDAFRTARPWITQTTGVWSTNEYKSLDLDANGWIESLPAPEEAPQYTYVSTILFNSLASRYPGGKYVVLYEGEGTIKYAWDAAKNTSASRPGRDIIEVTPSNNGILMSLMATDPRHTGNYIRNIRVVPEAYETTYATQIFNPTFIDRVDDFRALRFMDWMDTNNNTQQGQWDRRPTLQNATWQRLGMPVETMVELANRIDADPWFTMPHLATDEYVTKFAQYVRDHLESDRKVYVEYSNEVWNPSFQQYQWVEQQARQTPNFNGGIYDWYSKRTTEITRIWDNVFGAQKERVIGVMGAQASNPWVARKALSYAWSNEGKTHADYGIDAIAIAPYFGLGANRQREAEIESWTREPDGGLNKLFDEITQGGVLSSGFSGGALAESYRSMENHLDLAERENLPLIAYEGGQHLVGTGGVENNQAITNLFIQANQDPRMGDIYRQYFTHWYQSGGGLFMNFSDIGKSSKWGSWGLLESVYDTSSPKYDAVMNLLSPPNQ